MKKLILGISILALTSIAAGAGPLEDRQALMKHFGKAVGSIAPIAQGKAPFDAAAVTAGLTALNENAQKLDVAALFPAGSDKGDTSVAPKVWEDAAGFAAAADKFKADVAAAVATPPADLAAFQAQFETITKNCGACHGTYRLKKG